MIANLSAPKEFKISIFWSAWLPMMQNRILRDLLSLQRLSTVNRTPVVVGSDTDISSMVTSLGFTHTLDVANPDIVYVYLAEGSIVPDDISVRLPEGVEPTVVSLKTDLAEMPDLIFERDPYLGVRFYKDALPIPNTMPLDKPAPKGNGEPMWSPFL